MLPIVLALGATAALGYRAFMVDLGTGAAMDAARRADQAASATRLALAGYETALRGLLVPGQHARVTAAEAERQLDRIRELLIALEGADPQGADPPLAGALDLVDRLAATGSRAREHVETDQPLLAADLVFNEAHDLVTALDRQVERAASLARARHAANLAALRQEQALLAGAALAVWLVAAILLVPVGRRRAAAASEPVGETPGAVPEPALNAGIPEPAAVDLPREPALADPGPDLDGVAVLCADLARLADAGQLGSLLERAAAVLDASGVILWVAEAGGARLFPAAWYGYEPRVFGRVGAIPRDAANLTAAAFREARLRASAAFGTTQAALAAPLIGPSGPVGVLAAELRSAPDVSASTSAVATIIASQLATLVAVFPAEQKRGLPLS